MRLARERLEVDGIERFDPMRAGEHRRRPTRGALRISRRLSRDSAVAILVCVTRVEDDFAREQRGEIACEIRNRFDRKSHHDHVAELRGVRGRSGRGTLSEF